jgi:hypothetical protein
MTICNLKRRLPALAGLLFIVIVASRVSAGEAASALTTVHNPQGGEIVYGQVDGAANEASAMGIVLRSIHAQCGDKPKVGKVFAVRGTGSSAVFFTAIKHTQGDEPIAGLIIATRSAPGRVEAALVSDDARRFGSTINPMLKTLFGAWHPAGGAHARSGASDRSANGAHDVPALHKNVTADGSASVSLPSGWTMNPASKYGTILAEGPNDERALLGSAVLAMDSNNPRVQRTEAFAAGAGRNTSYARVMYYPYGGDLATTFVAVIQRMRQNQGLEPADISIAGASPLTASPPARCAGITGTIDPKDDKGTREFNAVFCSGGVSPMGQFMNVVSLISIPEHNAERERATALAILASYAEDASVVGAQASQMAAPEIARIHAIGQRAAQQAASAHAAEDAQNAAVERHWDAEDRNSQAFGNYLLDQTVIQDNQNDAHATVWNSTADAMVRSNPDRYQYVDTPNFWKGVDY